MPIRAARRAPLTFLLSLVLVTSVLLACQDPQSSSMADGTSAPTLQRVSTAQAVALAQDGARILDVRSPAEWQAGHLRDALHIPLDALNDQALRMLPDRQQPVLIYCLSGGRASAAGETLQALGYTQIHVLRPGGFAELQAAGLVTE